MAEYQQKPNSGALFVKKDRDKPTQPHFSGTATIDWVEYYVSGWTRIAQGSGEAYTALAFTKKSEAGNYRKEAGAGATAPARSNQAPRSFKEGDDFDDDIPF